MRLIETDAFRRQPVDVGCQHLSTQKTESIIVLIVGNYENDIWPFRVDRRWFAAEQKEQGQDDKDNAFTSGIDPDMFVRFLDTPERIVLEFTPEMSILFDGDKMAQGTAQAYAEFAREDA